jgi:hypothetical protein
VTSETVIQSRDKEHDWTDLREQSHMEQPTLPCRRNIGPSGLPQNQSGRKKERSSESKQLAPDSFTAHKERISVRRPRLHQKSGIRHEKAGSPNSAARRSLHIVWGAIDLIKAPCSEKPS